MNLGDMLITVFRDMTTWFFNKYFWLLPAAVVLTVLIAIRVKMDTTRSLIRKIRKKQIK
jgi:ATP/ADP translocase